MRYGLILAGGSGTRLWPMSRTKLPKQLIQFVQGQSLLQTAVARLDGLLDAKHIYVCAGQTHQDAILAHVQGVVADRFLGEPVGRDTLNAVGLAAAIIAKRDSNAVIAVFTADHVIEPADRFRQIVARGFDVVEEQSDTLVTFGITPTEPATSYGYLKLGQPIDEQTPNPTRDDTVPRIVDRFKEKPDPPLARQYFDDGPNKYLWNSGMFVWHARTLLSCIHRYEPQTHAGLMRIAEAWDGSEKNDVLEDVYPALKKTSIDYAVMEPAAKDKKVHVVAVPMMLTWLDVGSWPAFAKTCNRGEHGNALAADRHVLVDTHRTLVISSDTNHLIATLGCEDLVIVHTPDATLVCRADRAEDIKQVHEMVRHKYGEALL